jgi:uncharacterized protein
MAKQRKDSIDSYTAVGEAERAQAERDELAVMEQWLPVMASEDILRKWIVDLLQPPQTPPAVAGKDGSAKNVGLIMGALMKEHKNVVDGKLAQRIIKEELAKL